MKGHQVLTASRLREVLSYDAATGVFTWIKSSSNRAPAGSVAGSKHKVDGRIYVGVDGRLYKAHRLAWLYMHGRWPACGIDHIDGRVDNNRFSNLREANQAENMQNLHGPHRDNKLGFLGVMRSGKRFRSRVKAGNVCVFSKSFDTPEQAHAAYLEMKAIFHPFATTARTA